jgi:hypothetical protein
MMNDKAMDLESARIGRDLLGHPKKLVFEHLSRRDYFHLSTVTFDGL